LIISGQEKFNLADFTGVHIGAAFMLAFIIIGNLNVIWLSIYAGAQTDLSFFSYTFPRLLHDIFAFYGIVFWIWQVFDAYRLAKQKKEYAG
jgi:hypothetical protein